MSLFPDLARYPRFAVDTETTGVDRDARPVGCSITVPGDISWYFRWGHERGGNNCTLEEFIAWARVEFYRPHQVKAFFNASFDARMFVYAGICGQELFPGIEDAGISAALLNEHENSYQLDRLCQKHLGEEKDDTFLNEYCASQFGGRATREQAKNYWRAPGNIVEPYACHDTELTLHLYDRNRALITEQGLDKIYAIETALIYIVVRMNLVGTRVDIPQAESVKTGIHQQLRIARARWTQIVKDTTGNDLQDEDWVLPSTAQLVPVFDALGIPYGRTKPSLRFPTGQPSITKETLEASDHEASSVLLGIREGTKLEGTFVDTIIEMGGADGIIHGEFHPLPVEYVAGKKYGTISGRFSAKLLHQIPGDRNPEIGELIRSLFLPYYPEGQWIKADFSQIEYRFLAHYAGGIVAEAYNADPLVDFHQMMSDLINNPDLNRTKVKTVNFAEVYGAGLAKGAAQAGVSIDDWKKIKKVYHEKTGGVIGALTTKVQGVASRRGYIITWGGRRCRYFSAADARAMGWKVHPNERYVGTYKALNNLLQGSAADLIKLSMVRVARDLVDWENVLLHLTVHDELGFTAPQGSAGETFKKQLNEAMCDWSEADGVPKLNVPIRVTIGSGPSWGKAKEPKAK